MHKYLMKTDDGRQIPVTFTNPVCRGDVIYHKGEQFCVFTVAHMNNGGSTIVCDKM